MSKHLEEAILEVLPWPEEKTGYEIQKAIIAKFGKRPILFGLLRVSRIPLCSLHHTLWHMEDHKWLAARWSEPTSDRVGFRRKYYRKTSDGSRRLSQMKESKVNNETTSGLIGAKV